MNTTVIYALASAILISIVSLIGMFLLQSKVHSTHKIYNILLVFAIGTMLGSAFFHFIPETFENSQTKKIASILIILGILFFMLFELAIHYFQSKKGTKSKASYGYLSLYADAAHNFVDGVLLGAAWLYSPQMGITTTIIILLHEIPQELSDFGVLIKAGFTKQKALKYNFLISLTAILGTILSLSMGSVANSFSQYILPFMTGAFIYLPISICFSELFIKKIKIYKNFWIYFIFFILGLTMMYLTARQHNH